LHLCSYCGDEMNLYMLIHSECHMVLTSHFSVFRALSLKQQISFPLGCSLCLSLPIDTHMVLVGGGWSALFTLA
jgi:hypothetical protein